MTIRTPRVRKVGMCLAVPVATKREIEPKTMVREGVFQLQLALKARLAAHI